MNQIKNILSLQDNETQFKENLIESRFGKQFELYKNGGMKKSFESSKRNS